MKEVIIVRRVQYMPIVDNINQYMGNVSSHFDCTTCGYCMVHQYSLHIRRCNDLIANTR